MDVPYYLYDASVPSVDVYVLDTGINALHQVRIYCPVLLCPSCIEQCPRGAADQGARRHVDL
jgi:hypothetical protein